MKKKQENKLGQFLEKENRIFSKKELASLLGVGERIVRKMLSEVAKEKPLVSLSSKSGYYVATKEIQKTPAFYRRNVLEEVIHQLAENTSRIKKLQQRNKALKRFINSCNYDRELVEDEKDEIKKQGDFRAKIEFLQKVV